jgi:dihydrofolate synthase/folylpolyglutamate synthase
VLREVAAGLGAPVLQVGHEIGVAPAEGGWHWSAPGGERLALPVPALRGRFQYHNAAAAIAALRALGGRLPIPTSALRAGLLRAQLPGRFQVIPGAPTWILDVAHNPQAAEALASNLRAFDRRGRLIAVLGVLAGKDPEGLVRPLGDLVDAWVLTQARDPRALPLERLAQCIAPVLPGDAVTRAADVPQALALARAQAAGDDRVLVLGSFTTVGEALSCLGGAPDGA